MPVMMPAHGRGAVVHAVGGQRRQFEEGRAGVEQGADAFARQQLVAGGVLGAGLVAAAERDPLQLGIEVGDLRAQVRRRCPGTRGCAVDLGLEQGMRRDSAMNRWSLRGDAGPTSGNGGAKKKGVPKHALRFLAGTFQGGPG